MKNRRHTLVLRFHVLVLLVTTSLLSAPAVGQEFRCQVSINISQIGGSDYTFLQELRDILREYVNERRWTNDQFEEDERIDCSMQVNFLEAVTLTRFRARFIVTLTRPIYGSVQTTSVVTIRDDEWTFDYAAGSPILYDDSRYDPLASVIDFYVFLMLGYDYDTFSDLGGTPHFEKARRIAELARAAGGVGWTSIGGDRSRGELVAQLLDPRNRSLRSAYFKYHYEGLDHFLSEADVARDNILETLEGLNTLNEQSSRFYAFDLFFQSKSKELVAVFEKSTIGGRAFDLLSRLDPANISQYNQLVQ